MSIRTYLFTLLTGIVLIIASGLSYQSGHLFIDSIDFSMQHTMYDVAQSFPEPGKDEQTILGYHVTSDWNKVPAPVRKRFPEIPEEINVHHSIFEEWIYIAPPKRAYSLMVVERDNTKFFVSHFNEDIHATKDEMDDDDEFFVDPMVLVVLIGLGAIVSFALILLYSFKKIAQPMESLQAWAKQLTIKDLDNPKPEFRFKELNELASLIHDNMLSMAKSVKREQSFLSYASHELRTPIAVLRSNSALLEKVNPTPSEKERVIRDRIQRASFTMKSMTETLLWLSRDAETEMPIEPIQLGELVTQTERELNYLLAGKDIKVTMTTDSTVISLPNVPTVIVLNNLVRNAFQHTQAGTVEVIQHNNTVQIINTDTLSENEKDEKTELGFGLGMQLVEKLTAQFGWQLVVDDSSSGYSVTIVFC